MNQTPPQLLIAEPFHPQLHGITANSTPGIESHMLVYETFDPEDLISGEANETVDFLNNMYDTHPVFQDIPSHPVFQNYNQMIAPDGNAAFHITIGSVVELPGQEQVVIDRSGGLKRFQRRIKRRIAIA